MLPSAEREVLSISTRLQHLKTEELSSRQPHRLGAKITVILRNLSEKFSSTHWFLLPGHKPPHQFKNHFLLHHFYFLTLSLLIIAITICNII